MKHLDKLKDIYVLDVDKYLKDDIWKTFKDKIKKLQIIRKPPILKPTPIKVSTLEKKS